MLHPASEDWPQVNAASTDSGRNSSAISATSGTLTWGAVGTALAELRQRARTRAAITGTSLKARDTIDFVFRPFKGAMLLKIRDKPGVISLLRLEMIVLFDHNA
jgi:hypothetical protein